jgi:hypothetical protein
MSFFAILVTLKSYCNMDINQQDDKGRIVRKQQMMYFTITNFFELPGYIVLAIVLFLIYTYGGASSQIKAFN